MVDDELLIVGICFIYLACFTCVQYPYWVKARLLGIFGHSVLTLHALPGEGLEHNGLVEIKRRLEYNGEYNVDKRCESPLYRTACTPFRGSFTGRTWLCFTFMFRICRPHFSSLTVPTQQAVLMTLCTIEGK